MTALLRFMLVVWAYWGFKKAGEAWLDRSPAPRTCRYWILGEQAVHPGAWTASTTRPILWPAYRAAQAPSRVCSRSRCHGDTVGGSGFTLLLESLMMRVLKAMPVATATKLVGDYDDRDLRSYDPR